MLSNFTNLILAKKPLPYWVTKSFPIIQGIIMGLIAVISIVMVVAILVSPPETGVGTNAITGANESYYLKNKGKNNQGRIRNLIIACGITIAVLSIIFFILFGVFNWTGNA